jgi:multisubunit Na+/H+ antiporter MnhF subunit
MKRMSQYNWNWWFIVNLIGIVIGMSIALVAKSTDDLWLADIILIITVISFIPCLYVGMKPEE